MTYRSLLVLIDGDRSCDARIETAIRLAKSFDCHLSGVAPTGLIEVPAVPGSASSLQDLYAQTWALLREQAETAAQRFRDMCRLAGLRAFDTVVDECDRPSSVIRQSNCNDLLLLSRTDEPAARQPMKDLIEQLVLQSACPTLVLPGSGRTGAFGTTALVAWDDSREASRALRDALPMLRQARKVHVLSWDEADKRGPRVLRERLDAVKQWLGWHGVKNVQVKLEVPTSGISEALLSRAADLQADLIVMGAYGHPRWAERLLGGATQDLLDKAPVPLMMTH
jgi:nucleotide-binding universal stress UspA family protein